MTHHLLVVHHNGRDYGIALLGNTGASEDVAVMARGLFDDYIAVKQNVAVK